MLNYRIQILLRESTDPAHHGYVLRVQTSGSTDNESKEFPLKYITFITFSKSVFLLIAIPSAKQLRIMARQC